MFTISAGFVKFSIIFLGVSTFIFNVTFLFIVSKSRISISSYKFVDFMEKKFNFGRTEDQQFHGLNQHVWLNVCCTSIDFLCNVPVFPKAPNTRNILHELTYSRPGNNFYGQRIFGFLRPPKTARYTFGISSDDSSELWLSSDEKSENSVLIAKVGEKKKDPSWTRMYDYWKYPKQISRDIELREGKSYFIDILHVQAGNEQHLIVQWKDSQSAGNFSDIPSRALIPYFKEDLSHNRGTFTLDSLIPETESCKNMTIENPFLLERHRTYSGHDEFEQVLPVLSLKNKIGSPERSLNASYDALKKHFQGTDVYPYEPKVEHIFPWDIVPWDSFGISEEKAMDVVSSYMEKLNATSNGTYTLESVVNIEMTNVTNGVRYLLELDLKNTTSNNTIHLSEYVYQNKTFPQQLYYLDNMQWKRDVKITFVITAKNQGTWLQIFINDMAKILKATQDPNVEIIIFDYESDDLDLKKAVSASGIGHRIKIDSKPGRYSRRESFNIAIDLVDDPHSIVFLVDLHLTFGEALLNDIRKHTIEGHLIYCPIIVRQFDCSTFDNFLYKYYGYYETQGFGVVAVYKSDWDRVGGFTMNDENKYKWGGEDYDLIDSVYLNGLDYVRVKCSYVYHFCHSKEGMWS